MIELHLYISLTYRPGFSQIADLSLMILVLLQEVGAI